MISCTEVYVTHIAPSQWKTNLIVPVPKKGDSSLMSNYMGISFMSIAAKVYNKILLERIRPIVDPILRNNQAGFRPGRSCAQQIHILRRIMEGFRDKQLPLVETFIDFKQAFDSINRDFMFSILRHYGIPEPIIDAIKVLYTDSSSAVYIDGSMTESFPVTTGVLQGDLLAPFLFIIVVDFLLLDATTIYDSGVITHPRRSSRYPSKFLNDLDFADDICSLETCISKAQQQLSATSKSAEKVGLTISIPKTEFLTINCNPGPGLKVNDTQIQHTTDFKYLGSLVQSSQRDLKRRKGLAWTAFWKLKQLWRSNYVHTMLKISLFKATCLPVFLYACETWVITEAMSNTINAFATSCYRIMLGIKHLDRVSNSVVYKEVNQYPLILDVRKRQLKFLGHILRMEDCEPACTYALYVPPHGKHRRGRQHINYLSYIQGILPIEEITPEGIRHLASNRQDWRKLVVACTAAER